MDLYSSQKMMNDFWWNQYICFLVLLRLGQTVKKTWVSSVLYLNAFWTEYSDYSSAALCRKQARLITLPLYFPSFCSCRAKSQTVFPTCMASLWSWKWHLSETIDMTTLTTHFCVIWLTWCTICFQFIMINSLYMFQAPICSSSGGTVYATICIFRACYVNWLLVASLLHWYITIHSQQNINTFLL
jgi:hypothetical protein